VNNSIYTQGKMRTLAILFFIGITSSAIAQQVVTTENTTSNFIIIKSTRTDTFPDGQLARTIEVTNKKSKRFELHEFYQKITTKVIVYHSNGEKKSETLVIDKNGTYGEPCHEINFVYKTFNKKGKTTYYQRRNCDCKTETEEIYGEDGDLMNATKKRIYRRVDPAKKKREKEEEKAKKEKEKAESETKESTDNG
jgi:hypothetical protein